jgi:hypothetical protein
MGYASLAFSITQRGMNRRPTMALECGRNTKTYTPTGDGFGPDEATAWQDAFADFLSAFQRDTKKLKKWRKDAKCPWDCPEKAEGDLKPDKLGMVCYWERKLKKFHAIISCTLSVTVQCYRKKGKPHPTQD